MLATAKYDPVLVCTSCVISDSVFSSTTSIIIKIVISKCNQKFHVRVHSHIVFIFGLQPKFLALTYTKFRTFEV